MLSFTLPDQELFLLPQFRVHKYEAGRRIDDRDGDEEDGDETIKPHAKNALKMIAELPCHDLPSVAIALYTCICICIDRCVKGGEKQMEEIEEIIKEMQDALNATATDLLGAEQCELVERIAREHGWMSLCVEPWSEIFMDFFYHVMEWETFVDGSEGGYGLFYVPENNTIVYVTGTIYKHSNYVALDYKIINKKELLEWIMEHT